MHLVQSSSAQLLTVHFATATRCRFIDVQASVSMLAQPRHVEILRALHQLNVLVCNRNTKLRLYLSIVAKDQQYEYPVSLGFTETSSETLITIST